MGIFLIFAGSVLAMISFLVLGTAAALPQQLFAGEIAICGAVIFGAGGIIVAVDRLRIVAMQGAGAKPSN